MKRLSAIFLVTLIGVGTAVRLFSLDLPELSFTYEVVHGSEEDEIENLLLPASLKNTYSLRLKEIFLDSLWDALQFRYAWKDYFSQSGDYSYYSVGNDLNWKPFGLLRLGLNTGLKRVSFADPDSDLLSKDYLSLTGKLAGAYRLFPSFTVDSWVKSSYFLYDVPAKSRAEYSLNVGLTSKLGNWKLGARYRGVIRGPAGVMSDKSSSFLNYGTFTAKWKK